jgi:hypothetical protein
MKTYVKQCLWNMSTCLGMLLNSLVPEQYFVIRSNPEHSCIRILVPRTGTCVYECNRAVAWLRRLVADLSPRRLGFAPGSIHLGFVVCKVVLGQVFLLVLRFYPVNIIPPSLSKLISSGG